MFGLILVGGYSRRMGKDKALLEFHGKPQVEHVSGLLEKYCPKVFLSKRKDQKAHKDFTCIDDDPEFEGHGPLSGILSAMKAEPQADWLVAACDLPFITDETIRFLLEKRNPQKMATAFISSRDGLPEPLCAVWEAHAYARALELFKQGIHCPRKVLMQSEVCLLEQKDPHWLDNINTPEELKKIVDT